MYIQTNTCVCGSSDLIIRWIIWSVIGSNRNIQISIALEGSHKQKCKSIPKDVSQEFWSHSYEIVLWAMWTPYDGYKVEWHFSLHWSFHTYIFI